MRCRHLSAARRWMRLCLALALITTTLAACGPGPDGKSGGDEKRISAVVVALGAVLDDRVSRSGGDATDWKRFHLDSRDQVNITVYWDDPDIRAHLELLNAFGNVIGEQKHTSGEGVDQFSAELDEGDYYLAIISDGGSSVYSLEVTTGEVHSSGDSGRGGLRPSSADDRPE